MYFSAGLGRGRAAAGAAAAERLRRRWQPACPGLTSAPSPLGAGRNAVWIEIFTSVTSNRVDPCLIDKIKSDALWGVKVKVDRLQVFGFNGLTKDRKT